MTSVFDVDANKLINTVSEKLKGIKELEMPEWAKYVKTGAHKERPPEKEWWHIRLASLLRNLYMRGPIGVQRLRKRYGGRRKRGYKPKKKFKAGGKIIRVALQQLEKAGFVEKVEGGRAITNKGKSLLDKTAHELVMKNE